jgi:hypothetical protein
MLKCGKKKKENRNRPSRIKIRNMNLETGNDVILS